MHTVQDGNDGGCGAGEHEIGRKVGMVMTRSYQEIAYDLTIN
jgi:hypothetical protein